MTEAMLTPGKAMSPPANWKPGQSVKRGGRSTLHIAVKMTHQKAARRTETMSIRARSELGEHVADQRIGLREQGEEVALPISGNMRIKALPRRETVPRRRGARLAIRTSRRGPTALSTPWTTSRCTQRQPSSNRAVRGRRPRG